MKFIHIADVHLGAEPAAGAYSEKRPRELWETFESVIRICEEEQVDLLLIAGDLFHRQPLVRELKEADYLFSCLSRTKVVLIAGNHDYIRSDSNYKTFSWSSNVYPLFGKNPEYVEFPDLGTAVYGLSYHTREIREPLYDGLTAQGVQNFEILLAHGGDEKHIPFDKKALSGSGFDYIALGHIHRPQALERNRIVYAGALEPVDRNDTGLHGYVQGESGKSGVKIRWIPLAKRSYIHLEILVNASDTQGNIRKKIKDKIEEMGNENIYKVILKGRRDADIMFDTEYLCSDGMILEVADETIPDFDIETLYMQNQGNLIGTFIGRFRGCEEGSLEYEAMYEGIAALLENRQ